MFVIAVNVLVKPIWVFFIDRTVQNTVSGGSYGTYQALLSLSIIFQTVLDFGISSYNSRRISQNPDTLPTLFPAMLSARLVLMVVYMVLAYAWAYAFGYRGWELQLLIGVLLVQSLNSLVSFIRSNVAALHRFKTDGLLSVIDRLLAILICGFLLVWPATAKHFRIEWFVITQVVCYFIAAIIGYLILRRIGKVRLSFSFQPAEILKIAKQSFPYALLIFLMSIYNRADAMMIERLCADGKDQAGIWAAAFRLLDMANILGLMFATMLLPMFGRMLGQKNDVQPIVKLCVNMLLPFSFMIAVAAVFFSADIMDLLYHKSSLYNQGAVTQAEYHWVFTILMLSFPAWCLMYVYSTLLTANGSLATLNKIALAGVVLNLTLNFILIPNYKAVGGAATSFITQTSLAIAFIIYASRIIKLRFNIKWILAQLGYLTIVICTAFVINTSLYNVDWKLRLTMLGMLSIGYMFLFRFFSIASIRQFLKMS
ncbi:MAG: oligosaccharide flippase family protein [Bacteroidota bacterium]